MIERLIRALTGPASARAGEGPERMRLAVAALMVTAAHADDTFEAAERDAIRTLLATRFGLDGADVEGLLRTAEHHADAASGLFRFVKDFVAHSPPEDRVWLIEMLWEVAFADGVLTPDEDALIRKVAGLVYVSDVERGEARRRVERRLNRRA